MGTGQRFDDARGGPQRESKSFLFLVECILCGRVDRTFDNHACIVEYCHSTDVAKYRNKTNAKINGNSWQIVMVAKSEDHGSDISQLANR